MTVNDTSRRILFVEDKPSLLRAYGRYFASRYEMALAHNRFLVKPFELEDLAALIDGAA